MHLAPEVNFSVKRSRWHARLIVGASLLGLLVFAAFARDQMLLDVRTGVMALAMLIASTTALIGWKHSVQGNLRWDGQHWYWSGFSGNPVCCLRMVMDFQSALLVTVRAEAQASIFLWLEAPPSDAIWKALRRAIVSSQSASNPNSNGKDKKIGPGGQGDLA